MIIVPALLLVAAEVVAPSEDWHDLSSSERVAAGIDAKSIQRSGEETTAQMVVAMRDLDVGARRFSTTYVITSVTVNCRTRLGRMKMDPLRNGSGVVIEPAPATEEIGGPMNTDLYPALCGGKLLKQPGSASINQLLHRIWPPVPGVGRGW